MEYCDENLTSLTSRILEKKAQQFNGTEALCAYHCYVRPPPRPWGIGRDLTFIKAGGGFITGQMFILRGLIKGQMRARLWSNVWLVRVKSPPNPDFAPGGGGGGGGGGRSHVTMIGALVGKNLVTYVKISSNVLH